MKKKHVLVAKINGEIIEIDWTKIEPFESFKKEKYKLQKIDFFTSHYKNQINILKVLFEQGILTLKQINNAQLSILTFEQKNRNITIYNKKKKEKLMSFTSEQPIELIYKRSQKYLLEDYQIIVLLYSLLKDFEFIELLYNSYVVNGNYNNQALNILTSGINQLRDTMTNSSTQLNGLYIRLSKERESIQRLNFLLNRIYVYSKSLTENMCTSLVEQNLAESYIEEFFYREKYYVTNRKPGSYERSVLSFRTNKNNERVINTLQFHDLLVLIQNYLQKKEEKINNDPYTSCKTKIFQKDNEIPGQLSFF